MDSSSRSVGYAYADAIRVNLMTVPCLDSGTYVIKAFDTTGEGWWGGALYFNVYKNPTGTAVGPFEVVKMPGWSGYESQIVELLVGYLDELSTTLLNLLQSVINTFKENKALKGGGGGLYWNADNGAAEPSGFKMIEMDDNKAAYGDNKATNPLTLEVTKIMVISINDEDVLVAESGSIINQDIEVVLKDFYGEVVASDSSTGIFVQTPSVESTEGYKSSRGVTAIVTDGVAIFGQLGFDTNVKEISFNIKFYAPALPNLPPSKQISVYVVYPKKPDEDKNKLNPLLTGLLIALFTGNYVAAGACVCWLIGYRKRTIVKCVKESLKNIK